MLSYQHIYHAGNAADLQKHLWLITVLEYMLRKDKPLGWIDTHSGRGLYDLNAPEAQKIGEYKTALIPIIEQLSQTANLPGPLKIYFNLIKDLNAGDITRYPGSAHIAARMLRPDTDGLKSYDLHKGEFEHLKAALAPYDLASCKNADGLAALPALVPPEQKRGGVLIDPSYEVKTEYREVLKAVRAAFKKWPTGVFMVWYPILPAGGHTYMIEGLKALKAEYVIDEWLWRPAATIGRGMNGTGMAILNPPYTCADTMNAVKTLIQPHLQIG